MTKKQLLILLAVFLLIAGGLGAWLAFGDSSTGTASGAGTSGGYTLLPSDRTMGNAKAKVVMIEYGASTCPICAAWNAQSFAAFKTSYVDTGKVYYVFRQFPINPTVDPTAEKIARCLPEDKYFSFIDLLWRNQSLWDPEYGVSDVHGGLVRLGRMAGLSADQVDKCMDNKAEDDRIEKQVAEAQSRYGVTGTPTFIVDGTNIGSGNLPMTDISKAIDAALAAKK